MGSFPQCAPGTSAWPTPHSVHGDARAVTHECGSHARLCTRIVGILNATCNELSDASLLSHLLDSPVLPDESLTQIRTNGLFHRPSEIAALFILLANETRNRDTPLRFVSTNSNNGWTSLLAAAFLHRTHAGGFSGSAFNDLKWEWACDESTRKLTRVAGLSWRHTKALNPAAEAALMHYHPHARSPLWQTAFSNATELIPVSWVGTPPHLMSVGVWGSSGSRWRPGAGLRAWLQTCVCLLAGAAFLYTMERPMRSSPSRSLQHSPNPQPSGYCMARAKLESSLSCAPHMVTMRSKAMWRLLMSTRRHPRWRSITVRLASKTSQDVAPTTTKKDAATREDATPSR